jgi:hypothetical protein
MSAKRRLTFRDSDQGAMLFARVFGAYNRSPYETADDEELRRAARIKDARDLISVESDEGGHFRRLVRDSGEQHLLLSNAEYELFKRVIKACRWPPADAHFAVEVREFVDNAVLIEDEAAADG